MTIMQSLQVESGAVKTTKTSERQSPKPVAGPQPAKPASDVSKRKEPTPELLQQARNAVAARLEQYIRDSGRDLEFRVDNAANATVVTVRRADTGEVVRQFPNEEALHLLRRLNEQSGTFLDVFA
jgi:flagellar protein FlaG